MLFTYLKFWWQRSTLTGPDRDAAISIKVRTCGVTHHSRTAEELGRCIKCLMDLRKDAEAMPFSLAKLHLLDQIDFSLNHGAKQALSDMAEEKANALALSRMKQDLRK